MTPRSTSFKILTVTVCWCCYLPMIAWAQASPESQQKQSETPVTLQEVIVTAKKRNERLQDVSVAVTAINAAKTITIRGLTTVKGGGFGNPTAGIVVDDVPVRLFSAIRICFSS